MLRSWKRQQKPKRSPDHDGNGRGHPGPLRWIIGENAADPSPADKGRQRAWLHSEVRFRHFIRQHSSGGLRKNQRQQTTDLEPLPSGRLPKVTFSPRPSALEDGRSVTYRLAGTAATSSRGRPRRSRGAVNCPIATAAADDETEAEKNGLSRRESSPVLSPAHRRSSQTTLLFWVSRASHLLW